MTFRCENTGFNLPSSTSGISKRRNTSFKRISCSAWWDLKQECHQSYWQPLFALPEFATVATGNVLVLSKLGLGVGEIISHRRVLKTWYILWDFSESLICLKLEEINGKETRSNGGKNELRGIREGKLGKIFAEYNSNTGLSASHNVAENCEVTFVVSFRCIVNNMTEMSTQRNVLNFAKD